MFVLHEGTPMVANSQIAGLRAGFQRSLSGLAACRCPTP